MNPYYHAVEPQFNWWYIIVPVTAIAVLVLASKQYQHDHRDKIVMTYGNLVLKIASAAWAVVTIVLLFAESRHGILQSFYNELRFGESSELAELLTIGFFCFGIPLAWAFMYVLAKVTAWAKHGYLWEKRAVRRQKEREKLAAESSEDYVCRKQRERVTKRVPAIKWIIDETTRTGTDDGKIVPFPNERQNPRV